MNNSNSAFESIWTPVITENTWNHTQDNLTLDPFINRIVEIEEEIKKLKLDNKLLKLKLLSIDGKFTQEEVANIRKMIMSSDPATQTLADSIIENA